MLPPQWCRPRHPSQFDDITARPTCGQISRTGIILLQLWNFGTTLFSCFAFREKKPSRNAKQKRGRHCHGLSTIVLDCLDLSWFWMRLRCGLDAVSLCLRCCFEVAPLLP